MGTRLAGVAVLLLLGATICCTARTLFTFEESPYGAGHGIGVGYGGGGGGAAGGSGGGGGGGSGGGYGIVWCAWLWLWREDGAAPVAGGGSGVWYVSWWDHGSGYGGEVEHACGGGYGASGDLQYRIVVDGRTMAVVVVMGHGWRMHGIGYWAGWANGGAWLWRLWDHGIRYGGGAEMVCGGGYGAVGHTYRIAEVASAGWCGVGYGLRWEHNIGYWVVDEN
ncbi:uncharacterized protein A4U43_C10F3900 [Asparagus officinalis]|uniref:Glycine-rich protein n=1 Tax=Asparagus officinalis TaxID=4686 RepID=A0A5P1E3J5_ASPOF|nr:uncharacterized protein A4U43_C10F3900 [Asparagus officinalis]